jgi:hypothetical protein
MQMTDEQVLTAAIAIVIPVSALIYSNSRVSDVNARIGDLKTDLTVRINDTKETLRAEIALLREEMRAGFREIKDALKIHELERHE